MNRFDPDSTAILMAIIACESKHPKPSELPLRRFSLWAQPEVRFSSQAAVAVGYTASYGLLRWTDASGEDRLEWVAAGLIRRVEKK